MPRWVAAAAVLLLVGGTATAATFMWRQFVEVDEVHVELPTTKRPSPFEPTVSEEAAESELLEVPEFRVAPRETRRNISKSQGAPELFAAANAARRDREYAQARAQYEELLRRFPDSREAKVSRISLARVLMDGMKSPALAVKHFDAYLKDNGRRAPLRAEALAGKAQALEQIGHSAQARKTWQRVVDEHPESHHASRARYRIEKLSGQAAQ